MPEFNEDYKAKLLIWHHKTLANNLQRHDQDKLFTVFREIVTWCIKGVINKLKKVLDSKNDSIYKDIIFSTLKDVNSGFNIREIVATVGKTDVMKLIHEEQSTPYLYLGSALEIAIENNDLKMVQCILSRKSPKIRQATKYLRQACDRESEMFKSILSYIKEFHDKSKSRKDDFVDYGCALTRTIDNCRLDLVKILIENGANPNESKDHEGVFSPLCHAMWTGNYEIVEYLLNIGSNKFFIPDKEDTLVELINHRLQYVYYRADEQDMKNFREMINILISKVEDMHKNVLDFNQKLVDFVEKNQLKLVYLIACQLDSGMKNARFPLHFSIQKKSFDNAEFFLKHGASVFSLDRERKLPLDCLKEIDSHLLTESQKKMAQWLDLL